MRLSLNSNPDIILKLLQKLLDFHTYFIDFKRIKESKGYHQKTHALIKTAFLFLGIISSISISHGVNIIQKDGFVPTYGTLGIEESDCGHIIIREGSDKSIKTIPVYTSLYWMACHFLLQFQLNKNNEVVLRISLLLPADITVQPEMEGWLKLHRFMQEQGVSDIFIQLGVISREELIAQKELLVTAIGRNQGQQYGVYRIPVPEDKKPWDIELFQKTSLQVVGGIHSIFDERTIMAVTNVLEEYQSSDTFVFEPTSIIPQQNRLSENQYILFPVSNNNQNQVSVVLYRPEFNGQPFTWLTPGQPERFVHELSCGASLSELAGSQSLQHVFRDEAGHLSGLISSSLKYIYGYFIDPFREEIGSKLYTLHILVLSQFTCSMMSMKPLRTLRANREKKERRTELLAEAKKKYGITASQKKTGRNTEGVSSFIRSTGKSFRSSVASFRNSARSKVSSAIKSINPALSVEKPDPHPSTSQQIEILPQHQENYEEKKDDIRKCFEEALTTYANKNSEKNDHIVELMGLEDGKAVFPDDFLNLVTENQGGDYTVTIAPKSMPDDLEGFCILLANVLRGHSRHRNSSMYQILKKHLGPFGFIFKKPGGWVVIYDPDRSYQSKPLEEDDDFEEDADISPHTKRKMDTDNQYAQNLEEIEYLYKKQKEHKSKMETLIVLNNLLKEVEAFIRQQKAFELIAIDEPDIFVIQLIDKDGYMKSPDLLAGSMSGFRSMIQREEKDLKELYKKLNDRLDRFPSDSLDSQYNASTKAVISLFSNFLEDTPSSESWVVRNLFSQDLASDDQYRASLKKDLGQLQVFAEQLVKVGKWDKMPEAKWFKTLVFKTIENHIPPEMRITICSYHCSLPCIKRPSPLRHTLMAMLTDIPSALNRMGESSGQEANQHSAFSEELFPHGSTEESPLVEQGDKGQESTLTEEQDSVNKERQSFIKSERACSHQFDETLLERLHLDSI